MADWNDYRYFLALARGGTLAAAARSLGVEHTTVSRRVAALEAALGTKLFVRTPDGFVLTTAGARARAEVERVAQVLEDLERAVSAEDGELRGTVRLTTSEGFAAFLVKRLGEFCARYPDILLDVLTTNAIVDLTRREADVAVRMVPTTQGDLVARKIGKAGWALCAAESYLARAGVPSQASLAGHDVIGFDDERAAMPGARWIEEHRAGARIVMRSSSMVAALNAAIMGVGLAVVPAHLIAAEPTLKFIGPAFLHGDVWLVVHPDLVRVARVRAVLDFVVEIIARDAAILYGPTASPPEAPPGAA